MHGANPVYNIVTPMATNYIDPNSELLSDSDKSEYQSIVGSLNYFAMQLRWDLSYCTNRLSQHSSKPRKSSWQAMHRVLSYMLSTTDFAIRGRMLEGPDSMNSYSDSDLAGNNSHSALSQTGTMIFLNNVPVQWRSKTQCKTSKSIAQAEIYALSHTLSDARDMYWRLLGIQVNISKPLQLYTDNAQAKSFSKSTCLRSRLRGVFGLHEAWVQELKDGDWVDSRYVEAQNNAANVFTKPLTSADFKREKRLISSRWKL